MRYHYTIQIGLCKYGFLLGFTGNWGKPPVAGVIICTVANLRGCVYNVAVLDDPPALTALEATGFGGAALLARL